MKKCLGLILVLGMVFASAAYAENNGSGCGLGKKLFEGKQGLVPNVLAATTNGLSGNNTFGMTSGTSGCDADAVILQEKEQEVFVAANLDNISQEMAQGDGQYLHALSGLMGCDTGSYAAFSELTQAKYEVLFSDVDTTAVDLLSGLKREIQANPTLHSSCGRVS